MANLVKSYKRRRKQPRQYNRTKHNQESVQFTIDDLIGRTTSNNNLFKDLRKEATKQHKNLGKIKNGW